MIKAPSVEKYKILKASLGDHVWVDMTPDYVWVVRTKDVWVMTSQGPKLYQPTVGAREALEAIEHAFYILALNPVSTDGGKVWSTFDAPTWAKTRGREVNWIPWTNPEEPAKVTGEPANVAKQE